jgi:uncharacterized membrane protein YedE/YeeE
MVGAAEAGIGPRYPRLRLLALAAGAIAALLLLLHRQPDPALTAVLLFGVALGVALAGYDYGFTGGFRRLVIDGDGTTLAASLIVPAVAALVVIPVGTLGSEFGRFVAPIGTSLLLGAAIFGVGMQLANGCGSGTLVAAGQGSRRMWVTLLFFCLGGVAGSLVLPDALRLPSLGTLDLPGLLGPWGGLLAIELVLAVMAALLLRGAWPDARMMLAGAIIGVLAAGLFLASGEPWGITMALTLWGAKAVQAAGVDLGSSEFWSWPWTAALLQGPVLAMHGTASNLGLLLGALLVAAAKGELRHARPIGWPGVLGAAAGGLLMGVGARLSFGCNVGAFIGGLSSGSLHGLAWMMAALPGSWLGVRLRPLVGLSMQ